MQTFSCHQPLLELYMVSSVSGNNSMYLFVTHYMLFLSYISSFSALYIET